MYELAQLRAIVPSAICAPYLAHKDTHGTPEHDLKSQYAVLTLTEGSRALSAHLSPRGRDSSSAISRNSRLACTSARRCAAARAAVSSGWCGATPASSAASMRECRADSAPVLLAESSAVCSAVSRACSAFSRRLASPTCNESDSRVSKGRLSQSVTYHGRVPTSESRLAVTVFVTARGMDKSHCELLEREASRFWPLAGFRQRLQTLTLAVAAS